LYGVKARGSDMWWERVYI